MNVSVCSVVKIEICMLYKVKRIRSTLMEFRASSNSQHKYAISFSVSISFSFITLSFVVDDNCLYFTSQATHFPLLYIHEYV